MVGVFGGGVEKEEKVFIVGYLEETQIRQFASFILGGGGVFLAEVSRQTVSNGVYLSELCVF